MERLSPQDPCEIVVVLKGAQLGFTSVAENWVGHTIHHDPSPMMIVQPTQQTAADFGLLRISPMIDSTPEIRALVPAQRARKGGSTLGRKPFPGGFLQLAGANSAVELRSKAIRRLTLDEVDGYPADVDGEGDPVALALKRTATYSNRKVFILSTPTIAGASRIESEVMGSLEQRQSGWSPTGQRRYYVPCPECGAYTTLEWEAIRWGADPLGAVWICPGCEAAIENWRKTWMLARGEWRDTVTGQDRRVAGYVISGLYRPHGWRGWGEIAADWVRAKRTRDTSLLRVLVNTDLAQTWDPTDGQEADPTSLMSRVEPARDPSSALPPEVAILTAGVDVQADRLEVAIVGWGAGEESWTLDYRIVAGDPVDPATWAVLDALLLRPIGGLVVQACLVDAGYQTDTVAGWCNARKTRRIFAVKGVSNHDMPRPIWAPRASKAQEGTRRVHVVGVDTAKELLYSRFRLTDPGPGYCHILAPHCDDAWVRQVTSEKLRTRYVHGRAVHYWWVPAGRRNEALDCYVYNVAAIKALLGMGFRLEPRAAARRPAPPAPQSSSGWLHDGRPGGGRWLDRR